MYFSGHHPGASTNLKIELTGLDMDVAEAENISLVDIETGCPNERTRSCISAPLLNKQDRQGNRERTLRESSPIFGAFHYYPTVEDAPGDSLDQRSCAGSRIIGRGQRNSFSWGSIDRHCIIN